MRQVVRWISIVVIWGFLGCCCVFVLFPKLMPISQDPFSDQGLIYPVHINTVREMPGCDCYTYQWLAHIYEALRIGILWGIAPFVLALICLRLTAQPKPKA